MKIMPFFSAVLAALLCVASSAAVATSRVDIAWVRDAPPDFATGQIFNSAAELYGRQTLTVTGSTVSVSNAAPTFSNGLTSGTAQVCAMSGAVLASWANYGAPSETNAVRLVAGTASACQHIPILTGQTVSFVESLDSAPSQFALDSVGNAPVYDRYVYLASEAVTVLFTGTAGTTGDLIASGQSPYPIGKYNHVTCDSLTTVSGWNLNYSVSMSNSANSQFDQVSGGVPNSNTSNFFSSDSGSSLYRDFEINGNWFKLNATSAGPANITVQCRFQQNGRFPAQIVIGGGVIRAYNTPSSGIANAANGGSAFSNINHSTAVEACHTFVNSNGTVANGAVYSLVATNTNPSSVTTQDWVMGFDSATAPADGTVTPTFSFPISPGATVAAPQFPPGSPPTQYVNGFTVCMSSTGGFTKTADPHATFQATEY